MKGTITVTGEVQDKDKILEELEQMIGSKEYSEDVFHPFVFSFSTAENDQLAKEITLIRTIGLCLDELSDSQGKVNEVVSSELETDFNAWLERTRNLNFFIKREVETTNNSSLNQFTE